MKVAEGLADIRRRWTSGSILMACAACSAAPPSVKLHVERREPVLGGKAFARRRRVELGGFNAWFISPEDLVLAKLLWRRETGSDQQLRDIMSVLGSVPDLDHTYLVPWAGRLGLAQELKQTTAL